MWKAFCLLHLSEGVATGIPENTEKLPNKEESSGKEGTCQAKVEISWYQAFKEEKIYIRYLSLYATIYIIDFI